MSAVRRLRRGERAAPTGRTPPGSTGIPAASVGGCGVSQGYDPKNDPDSDPEMLNSREIADQPDQAEGEEEDAPAK